MEGNKTHKVYKVKIQERLIDNINRKIYKYTHIHTQTPTQQQKLILEYVIKKKEVKEGGLGNYNNSK